MPLLLEFRTWPDAGALGLNLFDISIGTNTSARPYFRAFSAGGYNDLGQAVLVDPDLEHEANGGFNPSSNPPGQQTYGRDPVFHIGSMQLVTRVSRSYSHWFEAVDASGASLVSPEFLVADFVPELGALPEGTQVQLAFRGATDVQNAEALADATSLDLYGDHYDRSAVPLTHNSSDANLGIQFLAGDASWKSDPSELDGARFYQVRLTFVANVGTGVSPAVSAVAVGWQE